MQVDGIEVKRGQVWSRPGLHEPEYFVVTRVEDRIAYGMSRRLVSKLAGEEERKRVEELSNGVHICLTPLKEKVTPNVEYIAKINLNDSIGRYTLREGFDLKENWSSICPYYLPDGSKAIAESYYDYLEEDKEKDKVKQQKELNREEDKLLLKTMTQILFLLPERTETQETIKIDQDNVIEVEEETSEGLTLLHPNKYYQEFGGPTRRELRKAKERFAELYDKEDLKESEEVEYVTIREMLMYLIQVLLPNHWGMLPR